MANATEALEQVRQVDGLIRFRFATDPEGLAAWRSSSNIIGPPRAAGGAGTRLRVDGKRGSTDTPPKAPPAGDQIEPAA